MREVNSTEAQMMVSKDSMGRTERDHIQYFISVWIYDFTIEKSQNAFLGKNLSGKFQIFFHIENQVKYKCKS